MPAAFKQQRHIEQGQHVRRHSRSLAEQLTPDGRVYDGIQPLQHGGIRKHDARHAPAVYAAIASAISRPKSDSTSS